jgi:hypothetical protein
MTGAGPPAGEYRDYAVFGLRVRSNLELPELFAASGAGVPDATIELGSIPSVTHGEPDGLNHVEGALVLVIPQVGRYWIEGGNRIVVDPEPGVPERNVRLFLLGSAFGVLLHQRGLLPLHANAIEIDGRAVAFMGPSGAGKSTLAAWFHDQGFRVIADDVCVVSFDAQGRPCATPGVPRLRLWREALEFMGREASNYPRSYVASQATDKFDLAIEPEGAVQSEMPLAALYVLNRGNATSLHRITGIGAAHSVFANTYRGGYLHAARQHEAHWRAAVQLLEAIPLFSAVRDWDLARLDFQCAALLEHARSALGVHRLRV